VSPQPFPWKQIIPLSLTVMVAFGIMLYGFSVFLTDGAAGGEFSTGLLSIAYGGGLVAGGALAYPVGRRADRRGVRGVIGVGAVMGAGGLVLFSFATEPWQVLLAWWLLIGPAGAMTFYEPAFIAVDRWCTREQRAQALAVLTLIGGLAGVIFLPGVERLISAFGWRPAVRVLGLLLLLIGGATAMIFLRREPSDRQPGSTRERFSLRLIVRDRRFVMFTVAMMLSSISAQSVLSHRVARFEETGFVVAGVAVWAAVASGLSLPGRSIAPFLAQRYRPTSVQASVMGLMAVAASLTIDGSQTWQLAGHFIVFGLAFGAVLPLRAMVMADWFSGSGYGRTMGAQWAVVSIAGASGPAAVGVLHDATGGYSIPMVIVTLLVGTAAVLAFASGRIRPGREFS
jgi:predicted MFS family arabinose efflux permease